MAEYIDREKVLDILASRNAPWDAYVKVSMLPFEDVYPVVYSTWNHGVCQNCHFDWSVVAPIASVSNYCPNCGSMMIGGRNE